VAQEIDALKRIKAKNAEPSPAAEKRRVYQEARAANIKPEGPSSRAGRGQPTGKNLTTRADWEASSLKSGHFNKNDIPRLDKLSVDPARGQTDGTWGEAEVGLGLEKRGAVHGITRSSNPKSEFLDSSGQKWDVKAFRDYNFKVNKAMANITEEITENGNNLMLDARYLTPAQIDKLKQAIDQAGYTGKTLWWP